MTDFFAVLIVALIVAFFAMLMLAGLAIIGVGMAAILATLKEIFRPRS